MSKLLNALQNAGCIDMESTMERFLGDEVFYLDVAKQAIGDPGFERLGKELQRGDAKKAFDMAHMLKGTMANCGFTPLYKLLAEIVEPLRAGNIADLIPAFEQIMVERERFSKLVETAALH